MEMKIIIPVLLFIIIVAGGCLNPFAPPTEIPVDTWDIQLSPYTPENVLENFRTAYISRDSSLFFSCLNEDFIFKYWDDSLRRYDSYTLYDMEGKPGEKTRTKYLFNTYESIALDVWNIVDSSQVIYQQDTIETRRVWFDLRVEDFDSYITQTAQGYAYFEFNKAIVDGEPYYSIILWKDESQI
ncbi:hypothetical protein JXI42_11910 [bacterium]|nr:hypothetical protein [bacterium]